MSSPSTILEASRAPDAPALRWLGRALRVPVVHKLWLAHAALVFAVAVAAGTLTARADGRLSLWVAAGVAATVGTLVHLHLLRLALRPLTLLVEAAERVAAGDERARAPLSALADPQVEHLVTVFNSALESVSRERGRLRELAARAQDTQEAERIQVARSLHDGTIQTLTALLVRLRMARRLTDAPRREAVLDGMRDELVDAIEVVRSAAHELRPAALSELGVEGALEGFAAAACARAGIRLHYLLEPLGDALSPEGATALYRVLQEAVENVVRHAGAEELYLQLRRSGAWVEAEVRDDGRGFPVGEMMERGRCLGLFAMEQRVARVGGTIQVESTVGSGSRVTVRLPARAGAPVGEAWEIQCAS